MSNVVHETLPSGIEYAVLPLPDRRVVAFQIRMLGGCCSDPADKLGLAHLIDETIDMGTTTRTGRELSDAFDAIGAGAGSGTGRETTTYTCSVLPEHFERAVELHADFLRNPTFPEDAVDVALDLARQELVALQDDAHGLLDKYLGQQACGAILGRHALGEPETIGNVSRQSIVDHWRSYFCNGRMIVTVAGAIEAENVSRVLEKYFNGFGETKQSGRDGFAMAFTPGTTHYDKELEQQQIGIGWPGVEVTHKDYPIQQAVIGILSGGMSGRLFTEVREKRGLVYWVSAWSETPRGAGTMFMGASTMPERCDETYDVLVGEVERLSEDLTEEELQRAKTGILASHETRGDTTRARCSDLASDLFFFGKPIPIETKIAELEAVTVKDVRRYLENYPRDQRCVVTVGPRPLGGVESSTKTQAGTSS
jgi:predicted Zn-dependent peptidase